MNVFLDTAVSFESDSLRIAYRIANRSDQDIFVYDLVTDGSLHAYPHEAYACLTEQEDTLQLLLGTVPLPTTPGLSMMVKAQPFARRVEPQGRYRDQLVLALPVREWNAYQRPDERGDWPVVLVGNVTLGIEFAYKADAYSIDDSPVRDRYQVGAYPVQSFVAALAVPNRIPVLKRGDDFERFAV